MCKACSPGGHEPLEVDENNVAFMLKEVTTVAVQAATSAANGWSQGANGLAWDMVNKWGLPGAARLTFVWGAALFFLPRPDDAPSTAPGHTQITEAIREMRGREPDPAMVGHMVSVNEQATGALNAITAAASKGDIGAISQALTDAAGADDDNRLLRVTLLMMLTEAGLRISNPEVPGSTGMKLFQAHVGAECEFNLIKVHEEGDDDDGTG